MKRILSAILLLPLLANVATAQWLEERVPLDAAPNIAEGKWYFTVITNAQATEADARLLQFLHTNEHLVKVRGAVTWNEYSTDRAVIRDTAWAKFLGVGSGGEFPCVILQGQSSPDGKAYVVAFFRGTDLMKQLKRLPVRLQIAIDAATEKVVSQCPGGKCPYPILPRVPLPRRVPNPQPGPQPQPQPSPAPATPPPVVKPLIPTVVPKDEPADPADDEGIPIWMFALPLIGAGAGLWKSFDHSS
jgi:hypothetical protein